MVGPLIASPHLAGDLQQLLQPLEALGERGERHAQPLVLLLIPGGADAEVRAPLREDIESGGGLDEDARMAIRDARHQRSQAQMIGAPGDEGQRAPALQHLVFWLANSGDLEEVIHHPEAVESGALGLLRQ